MLRIVPLLAVFPNDNNRRNQPAPAMSKKNKQDQLQPGDLISTMRSGEKISAIIIEVANGKITAQQVVGAEFSVATKDVQPAD